MNVTIPRPPEWKGTCLEVFGARKGWWITLLFAEARESEMLGFFFRDVARPDRSGCRGLCTLPAPPHRKKPSIKARSRPDISQDCTIIAK